MVMSRAEIIPINKQPRIYYGWIIVGVSFLCWFAADAFGWYTFGIFMGPITRELGWTTVMLTGAMTIRTVVAGLSGPVIGPLADTRHGARIIMSLGILIAGAVPMASSRVNALWQWYLFYGVMGGLGMIGYGGLVTNTVIAKWFIRKRGRAMGIATIGVSISGVVFVQLVHRLISSYGWRTTLVVLGLVIWGLTFLPVFLFVRRRPEDMGLRPDGDDPDMIEFETNDSTVADHVYSEEEIWTLKEALRTKALWLLLIGFNITGLAISGIFIHFFPYVVTKGFSTDLAARAMTVLAVCCAIVKIPWGLIAERIHVRYCITACYSGCAMSLIILLSSNTVPYVFLFAIAYGVTLGGDIVVRELVWANYYGRTFLGTIRGVIMPANLISMAGGPLFAAWLRDITGDYQVPYTVFLFASIVGTVFIFMAKPPGKINPNHLT
jgi:MFS family permease